MGHQHNSSSKCPNLTRDHGALLKHLGDFLLYLRDFPKDVGVFENNLGDFPSPFSNSLDEVIMSSTTIVLSH